MIINNFLKITLLILLLLTISTASAATLEVDGVEYTTIAAAVAAAQSGDTINIHDGNYAESVTVSKGLTFKTQTGAPTNVIWTSGSSSALLISTTEGVYVHDITFQNKDGSLNHAIVTLNNGANNVLFDNCIWNDTEYYYGIRATGGSNNNITINDCQFLGYISEGIYLTSVGGSLTNISITNCVFTYGNYLDNDDCAFYMTISGGTHGNIELKNNQINGLPYGFSIPRCINGVQIENNEFNNILNTGTYDASIVLLDPINVQLNENSFNNCEKGIFIDWATTYTGGNVSINNNTFHDINNFAIKNSRISNINISDNYIELAGYGVYLESNADSNNIYNNTFKNCNENNYIYFKNVSTNTPDENIFYLNTFDNNNPISESTSGLISNNTWNSITEITYTYSDSVYSSQIGNLWNNYNGADTDENGIGDTSFELYDGVFDYYPLMSDFFANTDNVPDDSDDDSDDDSNNNNDSDDSNDGGAIIIRPDSESDIDTNDDTNTDSKFDIKTIINDNNLIEILYDINLVEILYDLGLLETIDIMELTGDETPLEILTIVLTKHPVKFLFTIVLIISILSAIIYYLKEK